MVPVADGYGGGGGCINGDFTTVCGGCCTKTSADVPATGIVRGGGVICCPCPIANGAFPTGPVG